MLLAILVFSYRQVIDAYPGGGGAYAVSRANLGVASEPRRRSVARRRLHPDRRRLDRRRRRGPHLRLPEPRVGDRADLPGILAVITLLNLRGLGEAARAFLLPTMVFIVGLLAIIAVGLIHPLALQRAPARIPRCPPPTCTTVSVLLVLKAFSAGCSALTGVEAIANGVPLFKEPRVVRAKRTELLLGLILGTMLLGLAVLADRWHIGPRSGQTVLSQIMADAVGRHWAYYVVSLTITLVLALAANTSFGGLPVLASLLARDDYLPHLFALRGDRQVFANGIWALAVLSGALLDRGRAATRTALIPLFAIGVFTGFTLAQTGLVVHWRRTRPPRWRRRAAINGLGAVVTALATIVFLVSKFLEGAWVVVVAVPAFILLFVRIHAYYQRAAVELGFDQLPAKPKGKRSLVIVPVTRLSRLTEYALSEARSLGQEVIAVTVVVEGDDKSAEDAHELQEQWDRWDPGVPLRLLQTQYASVVEPIVSFVDECRYRQEQIVVLIPVIVPDRLRYRFLHNQIDVVLSAALRTRTDVVVARVQMPLHVQAKGEGTEDAAGDA